MRSTVIFSSYTTGHTVYSTGCRNLAMEQRLSDNIHIESVGVKIYPFYSQFMGKTVNSDCETAIEILRNHFSYKYIITELNCRKIGCSNWLVAEFIPKIKLVLAKMYINFIRNALMNDGNYLLFAKDRLWYRKVIRYEYISTNGYFTWNMAQDAVTIYFIEWLLWENEDYFKKFYDETMKSYANHRDYSYNKVPRIDGVDKKIITFAKFLRPNNYSQVSYMISEKLKSTYMKPEGDY